MDKKKYKSRKPRPHSYVVDLLEDFPAYLVRAEKYMSNVSSTDTIISETVDALSKNIQNIEKAFSTSEDGIISLLDERLEPLKSEITVIRDETLPLLQQSKESLKTVGDFIKDNTNLLTDLIGSQGKLRSIDGELSSIYKRMEKLESERNISWNKTTTLISILIAFVTTVAAIYFALIK